MSNSGQDEVSIEHAQRLSQQTLRRFSHAVVHELDSETNLIIEVNGVPVHQLVCMDSAMAELAAGWVLVHHFLESPREFNRSSVNDNRASVMIDGGVDIAHRRAVLSGELPERAHAPEPFPRGEDWSIPDDVLLDILREAWGVFQRDRLSEGSVHAALATASGIEVVAFDINAESAVAKVLGWCLMDGEFPSFEILIVNGPVTRAIVDAAVRVGVLIIATPFVPTADAYMTARVAGANIVGYMRHANVGLFGGPGVVQFEDEFETNT